MNSAPLQEAPHPPAHHHSSGTLESLKFKVSPGTSIAGGIAEDSRASGGSAVGISLHAAGDGHRLVEIKVIGLINKHDTLWTSKKSLSGQNPPW